MNIFMDNLNTVCLQTLLSFWTQVAAPGLSGSQRVCWNLSTKPDQTCPKPDLAYQEQTCVHSFLHLCRVITLIDSVEENLHAFNFFCVKIEGLYLLCNIFLEVGDLVCKLPNLQNAFLKFMQKLTFGHYFAIYLDWQTFTCRKEKFKSKQEV